MAPDEVGYVSASGEGKLQHALGVGVRDGWDDGGAQPTTRRRARYERDRRDSTPI